MQIRTEVVIMERETNNVVAQFLMGEFNHQQYLFDIDHNDLSPYYATVASNISLNNDKSLLELNFDHYIYNELCDNSKYCIDELLNDGYTLSESLDYILNNAAER